MGNFPHKFEGKSFRQSQNINIGSGRLLQYIEEFSLQHVKFRNGRQSGLVAQIDQKLAQFFGFRFILRHGD